MSRPTLPRGLSYLAAIEYAGVKRKTFDTHWRPRLTPMRQGACLIFDRHQLDALFDALLQESAERCGPASPSTPADSQRQNGPRNEWPSLEKGAHPWAKEDSTKTPPAIGRSTSSTGDTDYASVSARIRKRRTG
ncbi:hypothetical protein KAK07_02495 [Ideonella sp. 4Y16]|uniref:hypothetical protein n=1 Tax=Ideonella alba TaxID=2824118 RepID=UPI001B3731FA|nr:hypothetical protein [Ideonella alba]MBQ0942199.1 hypothetical protein [Ideonella alba]